MTIIESELRQKENVKLEQIWNHMSPRLDSDFSAIMDSVEESDVKILMMSRFNAVTLCISNGISRCFSPNGEGEYIEQIVIDLNRHLKKFINLISEYCGGSTPEYDSIRESGRKMFDALCGDGAKSTYTDMATSLIQSYRNSNEHSKDCLINDPICGKIRNNCNPYILSAILIVTIYCLLEILSTWADYSRVEAGSKFFVIPKKNKRYY